MSETPEMSSWTDRSPGIMPGSDLAPYASRPDASRGRLHDEVDASERTPHQRDKDRILHSGAFRKLQYKTQVFVYHEGDYFRTRLTHSLEVAQIARSISRSLGLNEDLAEALALAHDLGHTPFGHAGEDALDAAMQDHGGFDHNDQAMRILVRLEQRYAAYDGLNLTWETLEGVAKHNGPLTGPNATRPLTATIAEVDRQMGFGLDGFAGPEAQVAALADDVAYNSHDIDDGLRAGLFTLGEISELSLIAPVAEEVRSAYGELPPGRAYHETVRRVVGVLASDLLAESRQRILALMPASSDDVRAAAKPVIDFSEPMRAKNKELKSFLFNRMYRHYKVNRMAAKAKRVVGELFVLFMAEPNTLPTEWQSAGANGDDETRRARLVADYIAGMTDRYALSEHSRLFDINAKT